MEVTSGRYEMVPVDELVPYGGNAKEHTNAQIDAVKASMSQLGFGAPLVCWHNDDGRPEIVAGHARAIAAKALGIREVPCVFRDDWTDAQRRAYTLADNQTTMMTGWDDDQLAYELDTLAGEFDMGDFGFDTTPDSDALDDRYSDNVGTVEYEPKDVERKPSELFETTDRFDALIDAVQDRTIKRMLRIRAEWFCRFDFAKIADYYANQASAEEQEAFEALGLVLLDRDGLIANGFSDLAESVAGGVLSERPPRISSQHRLRHQQGQASVHDGEDARKAQLPGRVVHRLREQRRDA